MFNDQVVSDRSADEASCICLYLHPSIVILVFFLKMHGSSWWLQWLQVTFVLQRCLMVLTYPDEKAKMKKKSKVRLAVEVMKHKMKLEMSR